MPLAHFLSHPHFPSLFFIMPALLVMPPFFIFLPHSPNPLNLPCFPDFPGLPSFFYPPFPGPLSFFFLELPITVKMEHFTWMRNVKFLCSYMFKNGYCFRSDFCQCGVCFREEHPNSPLTAIIRSSHEKPLILNHHLRHVERSSEVTAIRPFCYIWPASVLVSYQSQLRWGGHAHERRWNK